MRSVRYFVLAIMLVVVLSLAACVAVVPGAVTLGDSAAPARAASAPEAVPATQPSAEQLPARAWAANDLQERLTEIYEATNDSVVNIRVLARPTGLQGMPFAQGEGSGFVWDEQGHIVTNNHVVEGAERIMVTFADGTRIPATIVGTDPESDLAVIKVDPRAVTLRPIRVGDSTQVKVGQFVLAIGNPFGLEGSMTFGIVSAVGRTLPAGSENAVVGQGPRYTIPDIIQTDAPVNPGNSGGVLLDLEGNVIGVPSAIESPVRASAGIGFAIPTAIVKKVVPALIADGKYVHPWIGIVGGTLTPEIAEAMGLASTQRGALVAEVAKDSPAEKAGLRGNSRSATIEGQEVRVGGDVITAVDGQPIRRFEDLVTYLARNTVVGQTIALTVLRDGTQTTVSLTLAPRPESRVASVPTVQPEPAAGTAWLGVAGITMTPQLATAMKLKPAQTGALIQQVVPGSPAAAAGLVAGSEDFTVDGQQVKIGGDVIIEANGQDVVTMQDLVRIVGSMKPGDTLKLVVLRSGEQVEVTAQLAARPGR